MVGDRRAPPLGVHLALLAVVLLAVTAGVRTDVSFSMDEPAAILQAERLAGGGGWLFPNPLPALDGDAAHFYFVLSDRGPDGIATYAKHPAYPLLLAAAGRLGGQTAMVLLSVAGALAAAGLTA